MNTSEKQIICRATDADDCFEIERIQELWSGYGEIVRVGLTGATQPSVIVKKVRPPNQRRHPRGWNSDRSHQRKLKSYQVETAFYTNWSERCVDDCRVPRCYTVDRQDEAVLMVMEDLDAAGFPIRKSSVNAAERTACLQWLANFHATFLGETPTGLWSTGTYWHLETRPDELDVLDDLPLKDSAAAIDRALKGSPFQTLVHGDAKLANFCFSGNGTGVAAVDFQYVGGGCGMKDLAYFLGSCLSDEECEQHETELLDTYFAELRPALARHGKADLADDLETDWRALYPIAWTDFHRFLKGWSPGHWKINRYSERLSRQVIAQLKASTP